MSGPSDDVSQAWVSRSGDWAAGVDNPRRDRCAIRATVWRRLPELVRLIDLTGRSAGEASQQARAVEGGSCFGPVQELLLDARTELERVKTDLERPRA